MSKAELPLKVPQFFWNMMSKEDQADYLALRDSFHNASTRERHGNSIQNDLQLIKGFVESRKEDQEIRSIVAGISFSTSFVCVNTSQLKNLLGRCKSSINNGFQLLGYSSAKTKVRQCIITMMPSLVKDSSLLKQWTMRCKDNCHIPQFMPEITRNAGIQADPKPAIPNSTSFPTQINTLSGAAATPIQRPKPFPTPMINGIYFKKNEEKFQQITPLSLPKGMPMLDASSPSTSIDAPFFDLPPETPSFMLPSSAPRPVSMPAFASMPDFLGDNSYSCFDDHDTFQLPPDDFSTIQNDQLDWGHYGDSMFQ